MTTLNENVHHLLDRQLAAWETARRSYDALAGVRVKELDVRGVPYKVQFNPARIVSSGAKVDARSIKERRCFLCAANRPAEQEGLPFLGHYELLVNPFPIFPRHLTVPETGHVPQLIAHRFADMLELARELTDLVTTANLRIRELGFKPYVAPAISSGAMQLLLTLRRGWHCSSVAVGDVWFGVRNRLTAAGLEIETASLPAPLFDRLRETQTLLREII